MSAIRPVVWQTVHDSLVFETGPGGPVAPVAPVAPAAPLDPSLPLPHPMKSNGTMRKIEQIKTTILFNIDPSCFCG